MRTRIQYYLRVVALEDLLKASELKIAVMVVSASVGAVLGAVDVHHVYRQEGVNEESGLLCMYG
jgi:hypothetical protein